VVELLQAILTGPAPLLSSSLVKRSSSTSLSGTFYLLIILALLHSASSTLFHFLP
jgi:hypothetical protein